MQAVSKFEHAVQLFDAAHREDPKHVETTDGSSAPASLVYHQTLVGWIDRLVPEASVALRLAAHCQHIRRFEIPRSGYPMGRAGYKHWRVTLATHHAEQATATLERAGYDTETITLVRDLVTKKLLGLHPDAAHLQDAVCLTFLELDYPPFAKQHPREKVESVVRKTWRKMTERGRGVALEFIERAAAAPVGENYGAVFSALGG